MKGIAKAIKRTPFLVTSKVGMSKKTSDSEFDEYNRKFTAMEGALEKFLKDIKTYSENVTTMLSSGQQWALHFSNIFQALNGEYDLASKYPQAAETIGNVDSYEAITEELKEALAPELELIQTKVHMPARELQGIMKQLRRTITKRDHKLTDYDRFANSLAKLRDKKEKSLSDEKNLFKLEQEFETAVNEYEHINNLLKTELPLFMQLATQFIDPLFHSYYYMQLNIFYIVMERLKAYGEGKYTLANTTAEILEDFAQHRGDIGDRVDGLSVTKRITSTAKMMATARGGSTLGRANTTASSASSTFSVPRTPSSFTKKAPPPPPTASSGAPPPYSAAAATKRPPPPPPLKPKPKPQAQYVVALYDFQAQADGDLDFNTGDRIEIVERTPNQDDWWTGKLNGKQGVFPGNYVQDA